MSAQSGRTPVRAELSWKRAMMFIAERDSLAFYSIFCANVLPAHSSKPGPAVKPWAGVLPRNRWKVRKKKPYILFERSLFVYTECKWLALVPRLDLRLTLNGTML